MAQFFTFEFISGNNLHEVEPESSSETFLVSMPGKFRRNVWVKRGDFVLLEAIDEGDKVKAEIVRVLTPEHIKEYTKANIWPKKFTRKRDHPEETNDSEDEEEFQNPNRRREDSESSCTTTSDENE